MGPTASGKTALALSLAEVFPVDLISVDSALVYRGLDIGAAKPDVATRARYPHALIDIRDPEQPYSAAEFAADARACMDASAAAGRIPLLVGGTGLYFRALERGLSALPDADPALRAAISDQAARVGWPALHRRLAERDPEAAARIHPTDPQRIQRALEVIALSGQSLSAQQTRGAGRPLPYRLLKLALIPDARDMLHLRIAERFAAMLEHGLVDEVARLRARPGVHADLPAIRAVGYRQAWAHLEGQFDRAELLARGIYATRQLAKRQITWLRSEFDVLPLDPDAADVAARARARLAAFLS
jgi:tRNA dimethylallyltransferase